MDDRMTPEQWRRIEGLYHAALERDAAERAAFLDAACGGDEELRGEVESLLRQRSTAKDFIEVPAVQVHHSLLSRALGGIHDASASGQLVGRALGVYELQALIGAGGMGEVYRAVDTRLNRTVAVKVLPPHVSNDPGRRERFKREAKIISSLNHPHICALYDVGGENGLDYLVMEHIEGETLQQRLEQGPLAPDRALEYLIQICDALDKAHRRGVVHRDLKPANVMLTKSGVKLLDFGAARWGVPTGQASADIPDRDRSAGLTADGVILGTLQYLSPEQVEGRQADNRSDIFAFGAVAYEMLTRRRAFAAETQAGTISAILRDDPPPVTAVVPAVPLPLARAISRCLAKDPEDRWQTANDLLFQLRSIDVAAAAATGAMPAGGRRRAERAVWTAALLAAIVATYVWASRGGVRTVDPQPEAAAVRFTLSPAEGTAIHSGHAPPFAISPNGRSIVYVGDRPDGTRQLWLRSLGSDTHKALTGTEGAHTPFWSPDSQWVGFFAGNSLKKIHLSSGIAQMVAGNVSTYGGAAWNARDVILFPATNAGLSRVSAQGGPLSPVTTGPGHFWPQFLGDGEHFIYAAPLARSALIGSLGSEKPRLLMTFPVRVSAVAYAQGYVFFVQDAVLYVRAFDERRLELSGDAHRIAGGVPVTGPGRTPFSVSAAGVLAYWAQPLTASAVLQWFARDGRTSPAVDTAAQFVGFALSPDGRQLVFSRTTNTGGADVWLRDLDRGTERRLTFDGAAFTPHWSPDGTRLVFSGPGQSPPPKLFTIDMAGKGAVSQVGDSPTANFASSWSPDGGSIVSVRIDPATRNDLWVQRVQDGHGQPLPFNTAFNESHGKVSPDGRWIAYVTDKSGIEEVWVASFPSAAVRQRVSVRGGSLPQWGSQSEELFFISGDRELVTVRVGGGDTRVQVGAPQVLFPVPNLVELDSLLFPSANGYVALPDGQRFLVAARAPTSTTPPIEVIANWRALLKR
jgi:Tol biopolymer transport system component/predicted Ser/Thr protein kinase